MNNIAVTWNAPTPSQQYPLDGYLFRTLFDGLLDQDENLSNSTTSRNWQQGGGELTVQVYARSESEYSEPATKTVQLPEGEARMAAQSGMMLSEDDELPINPNIPSPSGLDVQVS